MSHSVELAYKYGAELGEGPIWDEKRHELIWLDVTQSMVMFFSPSEKKQREFSVSKHVGALALTDSNDLYLALQDGIGFFNYQEKKITSFTQVIEGSEIRFNDGAVDARGRFLAGTMGYSPQPHTGSLYSFTSDGKWRVMIPEVGVSNGICWNADSTQMFYVDSMKQSIQVFNYDLELGDISYSKVLIDIPKEYGISDGLTIDQQGNLWVAMWDGSQILKLDCSGKIVEKIKLPVSRVTSLAFGGSDYKDLYITTARYGLSNSELKSQPLAGSLFVIRTDVSGYPENRIK